MSLFELLTTILGFMTVLAAVAVPVALFMLRMHREDLTERERVRAELAAKEDREAEERERRWARQEEMQRKVDLLLYGDRDEVGRSINSGIVGELAEIKAQLVHNGGASIKDQVSRIEKTLGELRREYRDLYRDLADIDSQQHRDNTVRLDEHNDRLENLSHNLHQVQADVHDVRQIHEDDQQRNVLSVRLLREENKAMRDHLTAEILRSVTHETHLPQQPDPE